MFYLRTHNIGNESILLFLWPNPLTYFNGYIDPFDNTIPGIYFIIEHNKSINILENIKLHSF